MLKNINILCIILIINYGCSKNNENNDIKSKHISYYNLPVSNPSNIDDNSNIKKFIPNNQTTLVDYKYENDEFYYKFNVVVENAESLKSIDQRLFNKGIFGSKNYKIFKEPTQEMSALEISRNLSYENNKITLDMFNQIKNMNFEEINYKHMPIINPPNSEKIVLESIVKREKTISIVSKLENLKMLYETNEFYNFLNKFKLIEVELTLPDYKNDTMLQSSFANIKRIAFDNGYLKINNTPIPIFANSNTKKEKHRTKFLNIIYNKGIFLENEKIPTFISALFLIENFNPDLF